MSDARTTPPSFDEMVGLIKNLFSDYLEDVMKSSPEEIEKSWQRYKTLNHLYQAASQPPAVKEPEDPFSNSTSGWLPSMHWPSEEEMQAMNKTTAQQFQHKEPPAVKGAGFILATERLPEPFKVVVCKYTPDSPDPRKDTELHWGFVSREGKWDRGWSNHQVEWLDESPTAAGEGEAREIIENILFSTGKFYQEQCTELADVILKELNGAGDGKEAIELLNWMLGTEVIPSTTGREGEDWVYPPTSDFCTSAQLYDIFKNRNK